MLAKGSLKKPLALRENVVEMDEVVRSSSRWQEKAQGEKTEEESAFFRPCFLPTVRKTAGLQRETNTRKEPLGA